MIIKTQDDWWELAQQTLPLIPAYAYEQRRDWNDGEADEAFVGRDHKKLYEMLNEFWWKLPDNEGIRVRPFFDICDLCSEYGVFGETGEDDVDDQAT